MDDDRIIRLLQLMTNLHDLYLYCVEKFTENGICSLFDANDNGLRQLRYFRIQSYDAFGFSDRCVDTMTKWLIIDYL